MAMLMRKKLLPILPHLYSMLKTLLHINPYAEVCDATGDAKSDIAGTKSSYSKQPVLHINKIFVLGKQRLVSFY